MNKTAIRNYAIWARVALLEGVKQRAYEYGITKDVMPDVNVDTVGGHILSADEKSQRGKLIRQIREKGYDQVMEEVAYTWFNRFAAMRYMEVNNCLPSHVRVFSNAEGDFKPEMLSDALHLDLPGLDRARVAEYIEKNQTEDLYRYLLLTQCNALYEPLPKMFEQLDDYTALLLPNHILKPDGVLGRLVTDIPEEDWTDQVQIIGWLYQYYNSELKDDTFAQLKKNVKVTKERIPAATQLFTPDWIVRYMVENSLGRLWLEGHPNAELQKGWKYYLPEAEQEAEVQARLEQLRAEYRDLKPEEIKVIDPCMGSGHILVYAFDVLMEIYKSAGWAERDAAQSIVEHNLYGLDVDKRACQLAYFAVMMKARQYDRRFLTRRIQPQVYYPGLDLELQEYGSLLLVDKVEKPAQEDQYTLLDEAMNYRRLLAQKYDVVVTNPPYMAVSNASGKMQDYVKKYFPDSKADLFACFIERCGWLLQENGYQAMITQHSWMFLSSFEKLREKLQRVDTVNMAHLGARAFEEIGGEVVQTTSFVMRKSHMTEYRGTYCRLIEPTTQQGKEDMFLAGENRYFAQQANFSKIPGAPVAYWVSEGLLHIYSVEHLIGDDSDVKIGMGTGKNEIFVREWWEVPYRKIDFALTDSSQLSRSIGKYFPYNKGGDFRKWYGNLQEVLWFDDVGRAKMKAMSGHRENGAWNWYCREGLTWSFISSSKFGIRYMPSGCFFDVAGSTLFSKKDNLYTLGFLSSNVCFMILGCLNPTLNYQAGNIKSLPIIYKDINMVNALVKGNITLSRTDWDSFETSWDFKKHPLV